MKKYLVTYVDSGQETILSSDTFSIDYNDEERTIIIELDKGEIILNPMRMGLWCHLDSRQFYDYCLAILNFYQELLKLDTTAFVFNSMWDYVEKDVC